jgi:hypothetical protein
MARYLKSAISEGARAAEDAKVRQVVEAIARTTGCPRARSATASLR